MSENLQESSRRDPLQRRAPTALRGQVAESLLARVDDLSDGAQLPTESTLMDEYGVSRTTIRAAVSALVDRGVLVRRQGKGTFVRSGGPSITHSLDHLSPFFAILSAAGQLPDTQIVDFGWVTGPALPRQLGSPESRVLTYRRLYFADGRPHALLHVQVAEKYGRGVSLADVEETPIFHVLERKHNLILRRANYTIRSTVADADLAHQLQVDAGYPLLVMCRFTQSPSGEPVEFTTHYLRADMYELAVHLDESGSTEPVPPLALTHRREVGHPRL